MSDPTHQPDTSHATHPMALIDRRRGTQSKIFTDKIKAAMFLRDMFVSPDTVTAYDLGDDLYILIWSEEE